jgi:hypothetical protein
LFLTEGAVAGLIGSLAGVGMGMLLAKGMTASVRIERELFADARFRDGGLAIGGGETFRAAAARRSPAISFMVWNRESGFFSRQRFTTARTGQDDELG